MAETITFVNREYFVPFDNTDNSCCWQIDEVGRDIDQILADAGIDAESLYEDWGAGWGWFSDGIEHSIHLECTNVYEAE